MIRFKKTVVSGLVILLILSFFVFKFFPRDCSKVYVAKTVVCIWLAKSPRQRIKGLSGIWGMKANQGMLFIFDEAVKPVFWMKEMNFPLDFIWIKDNRVVELSENIPAPTNKNLKIPQVQPKTEIDKVIEVNAGFIQKNQLKIGDQFIWP